LHSRQLVLIELSLVATTTLIAYFKCPSKVGDKTLAGTVRCLPLPSLWASITLGTIASFMLGLFATNVLSRWWSTRTHMNSVTGGCKNVTMLLCGWTAGAKGAVAEQRDHIIKLVNFAHGSFPPFPFPRHVKIPPAIPHGTLKHLSIRPCRPLQPCETNTFQHYLPRPSWERDSMPQRFMRADVILSPTY
jgi:hypothetical protein